jgi:uncharacterized protein
VNRPHEPIHFLDVSLSDVEFQLFGRGGLFWPAQAALLVADLHLGKEATFCTGGIPVPRGSSNATLDEIDLMLRQTGAIKLIILGDLFHARSALAQDVIQLLASFLASHRDVEAILVRGNHDLAAGTLPSELPIRCVDPPWKLTGLTLAHFPGAPVADSPLMIAGHLHPAVSISDSVAAARKLPCFYYDDAQRCLTLPAVGHFTGCSMVRRRTGDRVWAVADDQVIELADSQTRSAIGRPHFANAAKSKRRSST